MTIQYTDESKLMNNCHKVIGHIHGMHCTSRYVVILIFIGDVDRMV